MPAGQAPSGSRTAWRQYLLPLVLFAAALALRAYRVAAQPLWLDELYDVQLARLGPAAILRNSLTDQHPPLHYLLIWLTSGLGAVQGEWGWRWTSVLAGALTVPVVFAFARRAAGDGTGLWAALLLLVSPLHLYFSQEARAYVFSTFIAAASAWSLLTERLPPARRWWLWAGLTMMGLWSHYAYGMVAVVQAVYAVPRAWRQPGGRTALALALGGLVAAGGLAAQTLLRRAGSLDVATLDFITTAQTLAAGDMNRYGWYWGHAWLTAAFTTLALLGAWHMARSGRPAARIVCVAQALVPLAGFFLIARPLFSLNLEAYQARQFVMLLPTLLALVGAGAAQTWELAVRWVGRWAALAVTLALGALMFSGSLAGVSRYWSQTKSPEGQAVHYIRDHIALGETVVSLHYSADAALGFYIPDSPRFTRPLETPTGPLFSDVTTVLVWMWADIERPYTPADVAAFPARWIIWAEGQHEALAAQLVERCRVTDEAVFGPFRTVRAEGCGTP